MPVSYAALPMTTEEVESIVIEAAIYGQARKILRDIELAIHTEAKSLKDTKGEVKIKELVAAVKKNHPDLAGYVGEKTIRSMSSISPNRLSDNEDAIEKLAYKIRCGTHETHKEKVIAVKNMG